MKIYTCSFEKWYKLKEEKPHSKIISLTEDVPYWLENELNTYKLLYPTTDIIKTYKQSRESTITKDYKFEREYKKQVLSKLRPEKVIKKLFMVNGKKIHPYQNQLLDDEFILLSWDTEFGPSLRNTIALWLEETTKIKIKEL